MLLVYYDCAKIGAYFLCSNFFCNFFEKNFFATIFLRRARLCLNAHTYARAYARERTYTYIKHYFAGIYMEQTHKPKRQQNAAKFITKDFLTKLFSKIICLFGFKFITLHADTGNDLTQPKRTPRNVSTRTDTTETKRAL